MATNDKAIALRQDSLLARIEQEYPQQRFNLLTPITYQPELDAGAMPTITVIPIDTDPKNGDVYPTDGGKLGLGKPVLLRLAAGAGIMWNDRESKRVSPSVCEFCKDNKCRECEYFGRVFAYRAVGGIQDADGNYRTCVGEYELDLGDPKYKGKVTRSDAPKRAETGAFERATRQALAIKSSYTAAQLAKPFCVVGIRYPQDDEARRMRERARLAWQYGSVERGESAEAVLEQPVPFNRHYKLSQVERPGLPEPASEGAREPEPGWDAGLDFGSEDEVEPETTVEEPESPECATLRAEIDHLAVGILKWRPEARLQQYRVEWFHGKEIADMDLIELKRLARQLRCEVMMAGMKYSQGKRSGAFERYTGSGEEDVDADGWLAMEKGLAAEWKVVRQGSRA